MAKTVNTPRLPTGARRFRFMHGGTDKFYDIILERNSYTVHYGRWGSAGVFQTKEFENPLAARSAYHRQLLSKISKGYSDITGSIDNVAERGLIDHNVRASGFDTRTADINQALERAQPVRTANKSSGNSTVASSKTPENQGRKRRKLIT